MSEILTQKDDAASIVGEEEAEKIDEMKAEMKSEAVVIKSEEPEVEKSEDEEDDDKKKKKEMEEEKSEVAPEPDKLDQILSLLTAEKDALDLAYEKFRSTLVDAQTLEDVQPAFEDFGNVIRGMYEPQEQATEEVATDLRMDKLMESMSLLTEKVNLLATARSTEPVAQAVPERRSIVLDPNLVLTQPQNPLSIKEIARRSVFGNE